LYFFIFMIHDAVVRAVAGMVANACGCLCWIVQINDDA